MHLTRQRALIMLNGGLLAVLACVCFAPVAGGAEPKRHRPKGQYAMVSGKVQGVTESVLYVADAANEQLIALRYDRSRKSVQPIGYRDLLEDARLREAQGGR